MNKKKKRLYTVLLVESIIIIVVHLMNVNHLYSFTMSTDELGYWGNAAFFLQKNWGNATSYCPYYSFGYSIFLTLIMCLPISALAMYRLAIFCNVIFMLVSFGISYYLFVKIFPEKSKALISLCCMCMTLYSSYIVQSSIAWSECYLIMFVWIGLLLAYLLSQKVTTLRMSLFAFVLIYMYTIHQRTVGFLIAGILYIILLVVRKQAKIRQLLPFFIILIGGFIISSNIKEILQISLYTRNPSGNDYGKIISTMTIENLVIPTIREMAGQLYYLWVSSFGMVPLGIAWVVRDMIKKWKQKERLGYYYSFVMLSFVGTLGVSSIFMRLGVSRIDHMIYGRYIEIAIGFFLIFGMLKLQDFVKERKSWLFLVIGLIVILGLGALLLNKVVSWNIPVDTYYQGACATGMFWHYYFRGFRIMELCSIITIVDILLYIVIKLQTNKQWTIAIELLFITICWFLSGQLVIKKQIVTHQKANNQDFVEKQQLLDFFCNSDISIALLSSPNNYEHGGALQFYLENKPLNVVRDMSEADELPDVLIVNNDDSSIEDCILNEYQLTCILGKKSVYSLENVDIEDTAHGLNQNIFTWKDLEQSEEGMVMYGPYFSLQEGTYEVKYWMEDNTNSQGILGVADVAYDGNQVTTGQYTTSSTNITMYFTLEESTSDIEFRYYKYAGNNSYPYEIELYKLD